MHTYQQHIKHLQTFETVETDGVEEVVSAYGVPKCVTTAVRARSVRLRGQKDTDRTDMFLISGEEQYFIGTSL